MPKSLNEMYPIPVRLKKAEVTISSFCMEKYVSQWRGSNGKWNISRAKTNWIYKLGSHVPHGLNADLFIIKQLMSPPPQIHHHLSF